MNIRAVKGGVFSPFNIAIVLRMQSALFSETQTTLSLVSSFVFGKCSVAMMFLASLRHRLFFCYCLMSL